MDRLRVESSFRDCTPELFRDLVCLCLAANEALASRGMLPFPDVGAFKV